MTTDQIIRCCAVVGLTGGLLAIAWGLAQIATAMLRSRPSDTPATLKPALFTEISQEDRDKYIKALKESIAKRKEAEQRAAESGAVREPSGTRPGNFVNTT